MKKNIKKINKVRLNHCNIYIQASYNNTIISASDLEGNVIAWSSAGKLNFSGARKATPHAATLIANSIIDKIRDLGVHNVNIHIGGVGVGREAALRAFSGGNLSIQSVKDTTPLPHNGPRPKKSRRV